MGNLKKIAIIDVFSLLYRAFFAIPLLSVNNIPVNAIYGFIRILLKMYKEFNIDYLVSCVDKGRSGRNVFYQEYKSKRPPSTDLFKQQIPIVYEFYNLSNLKLIYKEGFEADDVINTIIHKFVNQKINETNFIFVITGDTDLLQLINKNVFVIILKKGISDYVLFDKQKFYKEYEFDSSYYLLYKILVGDNSDNVKGIAGIGPKKAKIFIKNISSYFSEQPFEFNEENLNIISSYLLDFFKLNIDSEKLRETLKLNYNLLKLKFINDLEEFNLEELYIKDNFINNGFIDFLKKYNFKSILQEIQSEFNLNYSNNNQKKQLKLF
jgi:DNA polymerase-1